MINKTLKKNKKRIISPADNFNIKSSHRERPNFLFIMTDQQRWDSIGAVKPEKLRTPTLDAVVSQGTLFGDAYCQGPICIPSRASFLTGKYVHQHRLYHNNGFLPDHENTWGDVLRDNGYQTVAVGRTHTIHKGFNHVHVPIGDSYLDFSRTLYSEKKYIYNHDQLEVYPGDKENFIEFRRAGTACKCLTDLKGTGSPFAMFLGFCAPHNPYLLPAPFHEMYQPGDFPSPVVFEEDFRMPDFREKHKKFYERMMENDSAAKAACYYYAMISMIDECLARVMSALEKLDLLDNTIIIFTSDHGEMLGDHGRWAKGNIYDQSVKIPFIVMNPKRIPGGQKCNALIESVDLFPAVLDYAQADFPNCAYRAKGKSIRGLLEGSETKIKDAVFAELDNWIMVATKDWKMSYGYPDCGIPAEDMRSEKGILFDRRNDPDERRNLFDSEEHQTIVNQLMRRLVKFHQDAKIPLHKDIPEIAFENMKVTPNCLE